MTPQGRLIGLIGRWEVTRPASPLAVTDRRRPLWLSAWTMGWVRAGQWPSWLLVPTVLPFFWTGALLWVLTTLGPPPQTCSDVMSVKRDPQSPRRCHDNTTHTQ